MLGKTKVQGIIKGIEDKQERIGVENLKVGCYEYSRAFLRGGDILFCEFEGEVVVKEEGEGGEGEGEGGGEGGE